MKLILFISSFVLTLHSCSQESGSDPNLKKRNRQSDAKLDTLVLGGGCYWCVEAVYERLEGVEEVVSGYSGGEMKDPSYEQVCSGRTGHAEVVRVVFDSTKTSVYDVLKVFFTVHDPTTLNRQGADVGTQYRSVIFYRNEEQRKISIELIASLNSEKAYSSPIVTEVSPLINFYLAEDYHQDYYAKNPNQGYCRLVVQPKVEKFEKVFKDKLKIGDK
jgi:peptide-methionine (S)-S-oxide reductase